MRARLPATRWRCAAAAAISRNGPSPRLLRDAHLGSIWEGTSNIVALDVARAARRAGALRRSGYLNHCLEQVAPDLAKPIAAALDRSIALMQAVVATEGPDHVAETRRAASALYHVASTVFLAWESARLSDVDPAVAQDRARLARLVLDHRLGVQDPLAGARAEPVWLADLLAGARNDAKSQSVAAQRAAGPSPKRSRPLPERR